MASIVVMAPIPFVAGSRRAACPEPVKTQSVVPSNASPPTFGTAIVASGVIDDVTARVARSEATADGATEAAWAIDAVDGAAVATIAGYSGAVAVDAQAARIKLPTASPTHALLIAVMELSPGRTRRSGSERMRLIIDCLRGDCGAMGLGDGANRLIP